jgi:hypothetical protein
VILALLPISAPGRLRAAQSEPAAKEPPDRLAQARRQIADHQFRRALEALVPCLKAKLGSRPDLEECLYLGDHAASGLRDQIQEHLREAGSDAAESSKWLAAITPPIVSADDWPIYHHDFFRRLARLFPDSSYADEFEYYLVPAPDEAWKLAVKKLRAYLDRFPAGHYVAAVELELAGIYDNLWDLVRPGSQEPQVYRQELITGNRRRDAYRAKQYREQALIFYQRALRAFSTNPAPPLDLVQQLLDDRESKLDHARQRFKLLRAGKGGEQWWYLIND